MKCRLIFCERPLFKGSRRSIPVVAAARPCLSDWPQRVDQSATQAASATFGFALAFAEQRPEFVDLAYLASRGTTNAQWAMLEDPLKRPTLSFPLNYRSISTSSRCMASTQGAENKSSIGKARLGREVSVNGYDHVAERKRYRQLLGILELIRQVEVELEDLNLGTSAVLLQAAIADIIQTVERAPMSAPRTRNVV